MVGSQDQDKYVALDGQEFKQMVRAALLWLREHQAEINALNVFPVPDGDTGTNMTLTMTSAWKEIEGVSDQSIGSISGKVAHGALMGARGNSGVILSQIWRGFARSMDGREEMRAEDLAAAMQEAADTAYKGVVKPVEGTILTVVREIADETRRAAEDSQDLRVVFERMLQRGKVAEARTPALLPVLRQAGVVDSGGQGLVVILEGMWRQMMGLPVEEVEQGPGTMELLHEHPGGELEFDEAYPYDVQYIVVGEGMDVHALRATIESIGDSTLVVGDASTIKVHVHVPDPGVPISIGAAEGSLRDVVVEDMRAQYQEFMAGREAQAGRGAAGEGAAPFFEIEPQAIGVVAVAAGEGLRKVFRSLGATAIIEGGQTMNPSTADILEALDSIESEKAIILPNNKNILMAAQQAAEMSDKEVAVVPTRSIPQGIGGLLALDQQESLDNNVSSMLNSAREVVSGEVTHAVRDVDLNGVQVREGRLIGLLNGELKVTAENYTETICKLLEEVDLDDYELVTLYYGEGVNQEDTEVLVEELESRYPDLEFEVVHGGQPHYPYLLSVE